MKYNADPKELEVTDAMARFDDVGDAVLVYYAYARCCNLIIGTGFTKQEAIDNCLDNWKNYFDANNG